MDDARRRTSEAARNGRRRSKGVSVFSLQAVRSGAIGCLAQIAESDRVAKRVNGRSEAPLAEIVAPAAGYDPALACVAVELEVLEGKIGNLLQERALRAQKPYHRQRRTALNRRKHVPHRSRSLCVRPSRARRRHLDSVATEGHSDAPADWVGVCREHADAQRYRV